MNEETVSRILASFAKATGITIKEEEPAAQPSSDRTSGILAAAARVGLAVKEA